jgi:trans-2,3-dihydro-3-hydroxyanthranilate isomerase
VIGRREFLILDVFARERFCGNQLAVFPHAAGLVAGEMQALAREMHFSETTFVISDKPTEHGFPVRIFTPACEVPFAGHPTLGTAYVLWDRFLGRRGAEVRLDLAVGSVRVEIADQGERLVMTQVPPEFGDRVSSAQAARVLGLEPGDIDDRFPCQEVSTGLWFLVVPVKHLGSMQGIKVNRAAYDELTATLRAKAVLAFCPETVAGECDLHVRVFCDFYDVPEDPATGSANGCLCAWLVKHAYFGRADVRVQTEQGIEMNRPSRLYLSGSETDGRITVRVGGRVVPIGSGFIE